MTSTQVRRSREYRRSSREVQGIVVADTGLVGIEENGQLYFSIGRTALTLDYSKDALLSFLGPLGQLGSLEHFFKWCVGDTRFVQEC